MKKKKTGYLQDKTEPRHLGERRRINLNILSGIHQHHQLFIAGLKVLAGGNIDTVELGVWMHQGYIELRILYLRENTNARFVHITSNHFA